MLAMNFYSKGIHCLSRNCHEFFPHINFEGICRLRLRSRPSSCSNPPQLCTSLWSRRPCDCQKSLQHRRKTNLVDHWQDERISLRSILFCRLRFQIQACKFDNIIDGYDQAFRWYGISCTNRWTYQNFGSHILWLVKRFWPKIQGSS